MAAPPATSGTVAFFAALPTAFVALSAALPIATVGAVFEELDRFDALEFELGLLAFGLDGLRLGVALDLDLGLVLVWAISPPI
jgi:hypothetical protein